MDLEALLRAEPTFHQDGSGNPYSYQLRPDVLPFIDTQAQDAGGPCRCEYRVIHSQGRHTRVHCPF